MNPRPAETYRAARRNAAHDEHLVWPGFPAKSVPYVIRAPRSRMVTGADGVAVPMLVPREQPKLYPPGWRTPAERERRLRLRLVS